MASIDINTPQNVIIQYELAGVGQRIFAFVIDLLTLGIAAFLFNLFLMEFYSDPPRMWLIFELLLFCFYSLYSEILMNGQSIGKLAMGIKVMKTNGEELEFYDYFGRWSTRLIDIWFSSGIFAIAMIATTRSGQRLGDILAGTTVIRKNSGFGFRLGDIVKLNEKDRDTYEFEYPQARNLEEKDVILIKNVINRYNEHENAANEQALSLLSDRIVQILEIRKNPEGSENKIRFLKKIISEYIILTR